MFFQSARGKQFFNLLLHKLEDLRHDSLFLKNKHDVDIDLNKAVGSSGLDIELEQVVAEIKTTSPYLRSIGHIERLSF